IGDASAVPGLLEATGVDFAAEALSKIGAPSVPGLLEALRNSKGYMHVKAAETLRKIGDPHVLPRRVLAEARLHPQERLDALERLKRIGYAKIPTVREYLAQAVGDADADV